MASAQLRERLGVLDRLCSESTQLLNLLATNLDELSAHTAPIHARAAALTAAQANVAAAKLATDALLAHLGTSHRVLPALKAGPVRDLDAFLGALQQLEASNAYLLQHRDLAAAQAALAHSQAAFNRALEMCGADFRASLTAGSRSSGSPGAWLRQHLSVDLAGMSRTRLVRELVPSSLLPKLRRMVGLMLEAGYGPAQEAFTAARQAAMQQALQETGLELPAASAAPQTLPEQLERFVASWGSQLRAVTLSLVSEQQLAADIWPAPLSHLVFAAVAQPHLASLLATGHEALGGCRSGERGVFAALELHAHLAACLPLLRELLASHADELLERLAALQRAACSAAAALFDGYAESVARDGSKVLPLDGTIHPLTAQVLAFVKRLVGYSNAADVLFGSSSSSSGGGDAGGDGKGGKTAATSSTALAAGIARLLMQLLNNLEVKARGYKGEPLAAIFLMNNCHYLQASVEGSPGALVLLGQPWLERHKDQVEDWGARYQELTWGPLIALFKTPPPSDPARLKVMLKDTFSTFNAALDKAWANQSGWSIPDAGLRSAVRRVIKDDVIPAYQDFMRRHADVEFSSAPAKYIKYAASDVAALVDSLFEARVVTRVDLKAAKLAAVV